MSRDTELTTDHDGHVVIITMNRPPHNFANEALMRRLADTLRALAVSGEKRHPDFPNVPTFVDSGFPEYVNYAWTSFYVKAGTPEAIKKRLIDALLKIRDSKEGTDFNQASGSESMPFFGDSMQKFQQNELERFSRIAKAAGIQAE